MTSTEPARKTSENANFPWGNKQVCYFAAGQGEPVQLHYVKDRKLGLLRAAKGEITIYAVWPGQYRSDLFVVDDLEPLAGAWKAPLDATLSALQIKMSREWLAEGRSVAEIADAWSVPCSTIHEALVLDQAA